MRTTLPPRRIAGRRAHAGLSRGARGRSLARRLGANLPSMLYASLALAVILCAAAGPAAAQSVQEFEKKVTLHRLANGWTFVILERPEAPVFSFATYADVGATQEVPGITGIAHMFEHMAFKGSRKIGTKDYASEKAALDKTEAAYRAFDEERRKKGADPARVKSLEKEWKDAQEAAEQYVVKNEFDDIIDREGGVGLNAGTSSDQTVYFYSMPSNKLELWAYLESERFRDPVFRQFYKERDVVKEERRMRTESTPSGRLIEQFLAAAFTAHPYGMPVVGYMSDLDSFSMTDAQAFYRKYYVPSNLYTTIVGDVKAAEVIPIVEKYFGAIPKGDPPQPVRTVEPQQNGERVVKINDPGQPLYLEGYHRPSGNDPDRESYIALASVLGGGGGGFGGGGGGGGFGANRTARLYRSLVRDKQIAAVATVFETFPGDKYPNLMTVLAVPGKGHTIDEVRDAVRAELSRISSEEVSDDELARVKAKAKADLVRSFQGNQGLAFGISVAQARYGDWRELFRTVERLDKVTKADVLRVARATFKDTNRTVGYIETTSASAPKPAPAGE